MKLDSKASMDNGIVVLCQEVFYSERSRSLKRKQLYKKRAHSTRASVGL
jgi:hypothetical protein